MRAVVLALLGACGGLLAHAEAAGQAAAEKDPAVEAARARQTAVKTFAVKFKRIEVLAKGGVSARTLPPLQPAKPVPEKEMTLESTDRLVSDGEKIYYEYNHYSWFVPSGLLVKSQEVSVFNGSIAKMLYPAGIGGKGNKDDIQGIIVKDGRPPSIQMIDLAPITRTFRGLSSTSGRRIDELQPSGATVQIDGLPCHEYVVAKAKSAPSYWLDPKKGYILRRIQRSHKGRRVDQTDVTYRRDKMHGWLPASWVRTQYSATGAILSKTTFTVLELRINAPQPAEQFAIPFAPGDRVYDQRSNKYFRIQADGSMRELASRDGKELPGSLPQPK